MLIILIGPKGSGKSHIGRLLESEFGVHFFHVEPLWMAYHAECSKEGREPRISDGVKRVHPAIAAAMRVHQHVCVETTGASPEILEDLLSLAGPDTRLLVRVHAPLSICLARIVGRDQTHQIPLSREEIERVYTLSAALDIKFDLSFENVSLADGEILEPFRTRLFSDL